MTSRSGSGIAVKAAKMRVAAIPDTRIVAPRDYRERSELSERQPFGNAADDPHRNCYVTSPMPHMLWAFGVGDCLTRLRCRDENLQFAFKFIIGSVTESEIKRLVMSCADQLGLAYNHQFTQRCFIHGTKEFPWSQYRARD